MSHPEEQFPSAELASPFSDVSDQLDRYVSTLAEIDTVWDYRICRRKLRRKLDSLFNNHELAGEAITVVGEGGEIVDYSNNNRQPFDGPVIGYLDNFFPIAKPFNVQRLDQIIHPKDILEFAQEANSSGWREPKNPIDIRLGLRVMPIFIPDGFDQKRTYIEIPHNQVDSIYEAQESHPFMPEIEIFDAACEDLLDFMSASTGGLDLEDEISCISSMQTKDSNLAGSYMELELDSEVPYLRIAGFAKQTTPTNSKYDLDNGFLTVNNSIKVNFQHFDWRWSDEFDPDEHKPTLCIVLQLTDPSDVEELGCSVISIPAEAVLYGLQYTDTFKHESTDVFAYEEKTFDALLQRFANSYNITDEINNAMKLFNNLNNAAEHIRAGVLDMNLAVSFDVTNVVAVSQSPNALEEIDSVTIEAGQIVEGTVVGFFADATSNSDGSTDITFMCQLDVTNDRFFSVLNVETINFATEHIRHAGFLPSNRFN